MTSFGDGWSPSMTLEGVKGEFHIDNGEGCSLAISTRLRVVAIENPRNNSISLARLPTPGTLFTHGFLPMHTIASGGTAVRPMFDFEGGVRMAFTDMDGDDHLLVVPSPGACAVHFIDTLSGMHVGYLIQPWHGYKCSSVAAQGPVIAAAVHDRVGKEEWDKDLSLRPATIRLYYRQVSGWNCIRILGSWPTGPEWPKGTQVPWPPSIAFSLDGSRIASTFCVRTGEDVKWGSVVFSVAGGVLIGQLLKEEEASSETSKEAPEVSEASEEVPRPPPFPQHLCAVPSGWLLSSGLSDLYFADNHGDKHLVPYTVHDATPCERVTAVAFDRPSRTVFIRQAIHPYMSHVVCMTVHYPDDWSE